MAKKILVVEDDKDSRFILSAQVRLAGYEPIEAETGLEGIKKALAENPGLILMDLAMTGMTGIDAARALMVVSGYKKKSNAPTFKWRMLFSYR